MPLDDDDRPTTTHPEAYVMRKRGPVRTAGPTEVLGSSGLVHSGGYIDEEWLDQLRGARGMRVYREMRDNDSTVGASLHLIDSLVRGVAWVATPAAEGTPAQVECAEFLDTCMQDMSATWQDYISDVLSMLPFGWSCVEKIYKVRSGDNADPTRRSQYTDGRLGWRRLAGRSQDTLERWQIDDDGGTRGWWQVAAPHYNRVFLPIEKLILFRTENTKGNPEGRSLLRSSYRSWFYCKRMQEIEAIGIERDLVGLPKMELPVHYFMENAKPSDRAQIAQYETALMQIRRNEHEALVVPSEFDRDGKPSGFRFSLVTSGGSRQLDPSKVVERYEKRVAQGLFTQFMFLGMSSVGTQALSTDLTDVFVAGLTVILDGVEDTHHRHGTAELLKLNGYKAEDHARIKHGEITKKDMRPLAKIILDLVSAGALTPDTSLEAYLRSELRLPEMDESTEAARENADPADRNAARERLNAAEDDEDDEPAPAPADDDEAEA
jgi:hypothetical protein